MRNELCSVPAFPWIPSSHRTTAWHREARAPQFAPILALIDDFRAGTVGDAGGLLSQARSAAPEAFENLVRGVEFKLIEMPLGRLQLIGNDYDPFIYAISWEKPPTQSAVSRGDFAGQLNLVAGPRRSPVARPCFVPS